jgi:hypothetical protein
LFTCAKGSGIYGPQTKRTFAPVKKFTQKTIYELNDCPKKNLVGILIPFIKVTARIPDLASGWPARVRSKQNLVGFFANMIQADVVTTAE